MMAKISEMAAPAMMGLAAIYLVLLARLHARVRRCKASRCDETFPAIISCHVADTFVLLRFIFLAKGDFYDANRPLIWSLRGVLLVGVACLALSGMS